MIIHDEKTTYHSLLTIFVKQCYETLIDVAKENGGKLPIRTNFILDEFANMPPLKDVDSMVSAARSRDIRFTFIIQNFAQLNDVYGKEVAEVIKGNCGNLIYLISTEMAALEEISKMCGEVKSKEKDKTASTPLITVTDLQKLKLFQAIILRLRMYPFKTKLEPDFKMDWGIKREKATFVERESHQIALFDIKKYVTEEKRKKNLETNPLGDASPFGNPFAPNPMGNPFASANPFLPSGNIMNNQANPFSKPGPLTNEEIDKMIADIDKKLKELDEEEEKEKASLNQIEDLPKLEPVQEIKEPVKNNQDNNINKIKEEKPKYPEIKRKEEPVQKQSEIPDKPKINIDVDSVIVNDNIISDDEFFDDFFNDD